MFPLPRYILERAALVYLGGITNFYITHSILAASKNIQGGWESLVTPETSLSYKIAGIGAGLLAGALFVAFSYFGVGIGKKTIHRNGSS